MGIQQLRFSPLTSAHGHLLPLQHHAVPVRVHEVLRGVRVLPQQLQRRAARVHATRLPTPQATVKPRLEEEQPVELEGEGGLVDAAQTRLGAVEERGRLRGRKCAILR